MILNTYELTPDELIVYEKLLTKMPETIYDDNISDLRIFVALLAIQISSTNQAVEDWYKELDPYTASENSLKSMSLLVGYKWNIELPLEYNRNRLLFYMYRRKYRGTVASIKNLIRTNADDEDFYSNSLNSDIEVIEGLWGPLSSNLIKDDFSDFIPFLGATVTRNKTFPIEVFKGGRNLLLETDNYRAFNSNSETLEIKHNNSSVYRVTVSNPDVNNNFGMFFNRFTNASLLEVGKEYVISVDYFIEGFYGVEGSSVYIRLTYIDDTVKTFYYDGSNGFVNFRVENNWNKWHTLSGNFTPTKEVKNVWFYFYAGKVNNASVLYTVPKIELGSTPTEYSPAPEDGYDYLGSDGAYHIQTSGGTSREKFIKNVGRMDDKTNHSVIVHSFNNNLMIGNGAFFELIRENITKNYKTENIAENGNRQIQFSTQPVDNSLDFIASNPSIRSSKFNGAVIRVVIPEHLAITRLDIEEVRPAGTILEFLLNLIARIVSSRVEVDSNLMELDIQHGSYYDEYIRDWGLDNELGVVFNRPLVMYSLSLATNYSNIDIEINKED